MTSASKRPVINPWIITISVMLATFMEVLDSTVVNVSIPHISGNLGSTYEEGTWVITSYLVSNAIILPMSGWLARMFGRRTMLLVCVAGFTLASALCGAATSLSGLIFFRILQGTAGGGLQPLSQAAMMESFPPEKHGQAMAAFGLGVIFAPIVGPTLGGWITDNYTWRWIFYINVPIGLLSMLMISQFVFDPEYLQGNRSKMRIDYWGISFLALGLGTLQVVLDTGQRKDWFAHRDIRILGLLCVAGLLAFVIRELLVSQPVVDLRALLDRTFATGVFLITIVGFCLYASLTILPMFLQTLLGYPALQAGLAVSPRGLGALVMTPISGILTGKFDPRKILACGFLVGALSMLSFSHLSLNAGYWDIFWPQVFQGVAMSMMFIPLATAAISHLPKEKVGNATSIFNLMRNIGGSIGIAFMETLITRREQVHHNHLISNISVYDQQTREIIQGLTSFFLSKGADAVTASQRAYGSIYGLLQQHAAMLAFVEAFWVMAMVFLIALPFVALLRNPRHTIAAAKKAAAEAAAEATETPEVPELVHT